MDASGTIRNRNPFIGAGTVTFSGDEAQGTLTVPEGAPLLDAEGAPILNPRTSKPTLGPAPAALTWTPAGGSASDLVPIGATDERMLEGVWSALSNKSMAGEPSFPHGPGVRASVNAEYYANRFTLEVAATDTSAGVPEAVAALTQLRDMVIAAVRVAH